MVWEYTPRQIAGFLYFQAQRAKREKAQAIDTGFYGSRADPKDVNKKLKELAK